MMKFKSQFNIIVSVIAATFVAACGYLPETARNVSSQRTNDGVVDPDTAETVRHSVSTMVVDGADSNSAFSLTVGAKQRVMDASALQAQFISIFGATNPRGTQWVLDADKCHNPPNVFDYQFDRWAVTGADHFTITEAVSLGDRHYRVSPFSPLSISRLQTKRTTAVSLAYLKTLRTYLAEACRVRIAKDFAQLSGNSTRISTPRYQCSVSDPVPTTINVDYASDGRTALMRKLSQPSAADISGFMSVMFGLPVDDNELHVGADEYAGVFATAITEWRAQGVLANSVIEQDRLRGLYEMLCVAVGTDQRAFMR